MLMDCQVSSPDGWLAVAPACLTLILTQAICIPGVAPVFDTTVEIPHENQAAYAL